VIGFLVTLGLTLPQAIAFNVLWQEERVAEWPCMYAIFEAESSWNPKAVGDNGYSLGLPQRHVPSQGMPKSNWNIRDQVYWSMEYADERYGGFCNALSFREVNNYW